MPRAFGFLSLVAAAFLLAVAGVAQGAAAPDLPPPVQAAVRDGGAGGVTVSATWLGAREDRLAIRLSFDTHSVDLSRFDVLANTVLRDGSGRELRPVRWQEEPGSSHHRSGVLYFPIPDNLQGQLVILVRNLAGVKSRELAFELRR